jgi:hypothetical protein
VCKTLNTTGSRARTLTALSAQRQGRRHLSLGVFPNPEDLAYGVTASALSLPRSVHHGPMFWGASAKPGRGHEIYEHWLEPADAT